MTRSRRAGSIKNAQIEAKRPAKIDPSRPRIKDRLVSTLHAACYVLPVYQLVDKVAEISRALVAEIDVIRMFPNITA